MLRIVYLYVGSDDVDADLRFLVDGLGGELAWRFHAFDAMDEAHSDPKNPSAVR